MEGDEETDTSIQARTSAEGKSLKLGLGYYHANFLSTLSVPTCKCDTGHIQDKVEQLQQFRQTPKRQIFLLNSALFTSKQTLRPFLLLEERCKLPVRVKSMQDAQLL
jgi:hypothetical protein